MSAPELSSLGNRSEPHRSAAKGCSGGSYTLCSPGAGHSHHASTASPWGSGRYRVALRNKGAAYREFAQIAQAFATQSAEEPLSLGCFACPDRSRMGKTGVVGSLSHFHARFWQGVCCTRFSARTPCHVTRGDTGFADFWCPWAPGCSGFVLIHFHFTSEIQTSADRRRGCRFARVEVCDTCGPKRRQKLPDWDTL
jgi:hypothetical protein